MKIEYLVKRAQKMSSTTNAPSKAIVNQTPSEEGVPVAIEPLGMSDTPASLQVQPDGAQARVVRPDVPAETDRPEKRPRCELRSAPEPSSTIPSFSFSAPAPSEEDYQRLFPLPIDICVREKIWWTSMNPVDFQVQAMKYMEMVRLGMWNATEYSLHLNNKVAELAAENRNLCKNLDEANVKNLRLIEELASARAKAICLEGEKQTLVEHKGRVDEENARLVEQKGFLDKVNARLEDEKARLVENCQKGLADEVGPHWEQGMRIGVRQAVKKFGVIDPKIKYFTPDYTDACGEPELEEGVKKGIEVE